VATVDHAKNLPWLPYSLAPVGCYPRLPRHVRWGSRIRPATQPQVKWPRPAAYYRPPSIVRPLASLNRSVGSIPPGVLAAFRVATACHLRLRACCVAVGADRPDGWMPMSCVSIPAEIPPTNTLNPGNPRTGVDALLAHPVSCPRQTLTLRHVRHPDYRTTIIEPRRPECIMPGL
jgi:hypothetical protein